MPSVLVNLDFNRNQALNLRFQNLASAPASPVEGQVYYHTGDKVLYWWNGTSWVAATGSGTVASVTGTAPIVSSGGANPAISLAAGGITDTHVNASAAIAYTKLAAPTAAVSFNSQRITNVADPTAAQDAATKSYVDAAANGLDWKSSVRVASTANLTIPPGGTALTVDGVTLANGDRVLLKNQTTASQNGVYVVGGVGSSVTLTRATDADQNAEVTGGLAMFVTEGTTQADTAWVLTTNDAITVGTTALTFTQFGAGATYTAGTGLSLAGNVFSLTTPVSVANGGTGAGTAAAARAALGVPGVYSTAVGDGTATSFTITHNLGTRDVHTTVYQAGSPYAEVIADVTHDTTNTCVVAFATAPTTGQYRVVVVG